MLKIMQLNSFDLFLYFDDINTQFSSSNKKNKCPYKLERLSLMIKEKNPDVLFMNEVGGSESAFNFNKLYLNDEYNVSIAVSNDKRGIDSCFLIKKDLTYKERFINKIDYKNKVTKMSRSINFLTLEKEGKPVLFIFGVHLKSKRAQANDNDHIVKRYDEVNSVVHTMRKVRKNNKVPYILMGDFNGDASREGDFEFGSIYSKTSLRDIHEIKGSSLDHRYSFVRFENDEEKKYQLDYIMLSKGIQDKVVRSERVLYKDEFGFPMVYFTQRDKELFPSDHYPQYAEVLIEVR